jgi:hypothetical protein
MLCNVANMPCCDFKEWQAFVQAPGFAQTNKNIDLNFWIIK